MKKILFAAVLILAVSPLFAQKQNSGMARHEVSVSYGVAPATNWIDSYTNFWGSLFTDSDTSLEGWGAVTAGYNFRLMRNFSLGAQIVYTTNKNKMERGDLKYTNRYWSVMPNVKWNWLNLRIVTLYSRVGAGLTFAKSKIAGETDDTSTQFAFQVSPIGVEVGGRLAAYAEGGIGVSGSLLVGARYRF